MMVRITKEQEHALERLGVSPEAVSEDDVSEAGRIWVNPPSGAVLIDLDGSVEPA